MHSQSAVMMGILHGAETYRDVQLFLILFTLSLQSGGEL